MSDNFKKEETKKVKEEVKEEINQEIKEEINQEIKEKINKEKKDNKIKKELVEWGKAIIFAGLVALLLLIFGRPSFVIGASMNPTFQEGDLVLVERVSQFLSAPKHGDIVVASSDIKLNENSYKDLIKRVIAVSGDTIVIKDGFVYVNGNKINEPYLNDGITNNEFEGIVPENHVFIMGDNRLHSNDSRSDEIGFVPYERLKGKVYFRIWPIDKIKLF